MAGPGALSAPALPQRRVELVKDGEAIAAIEPPHAVDAEGTEVEVAMAVTDNRLVLEVAHRDKDYRAPILVDPVVNDYLSWKDVPGYHDPSATYNGWYNEHGGCHAQACGAVYGHAGPSYHGSGLYAWGQGGHFFTGGRYSQWIWRAPGDAYIYRADFGWAHHDVANSNLFEGIFSYSRFQWERVGVGAPPAPGQHLFYAQPYIEPNYLDYDFKTHCQQSCGWGHPGAEAGTPGNAMVFGVQMRSNATVHQRPMAYLGGAQVSLHEFNPPRYYYGDEGDSLIHTGLPDGWVRSANIHTEIAATDDGLGMKTIDLTSPTGWSHPGQPDSCNGARARTTDRPCPYFHNATFDYNTDNMPEGIVPIRATARDIVDNRADLASWQVKVDRTAPELEVSGPLRDAAGTTIEGSESDLWLSAYDGDDQAPRSGVERIEVKVDDRRVDLETQSCPEANCDMDRMWTLVLDSFSPGPHRIQVFSTDQAGNATSSAPWTVTVSHGAEPPDEPGGPQPSSTASGPDCVLSPGEQNGEDVVEVTSGLFDTGPELTERFQDGSYKVSRCDVFGKLLFSQSVGQITEPSGSRAWVPRATFRRLPDGGYQGMLPLYGRPSNSSWAAEWESQGSLAKAAVVPPTLGVTRQASTAGQAEAEASGRPERCRNRQARFFGAFRLSRSYRYSTNLDGLAPTSAITRQRFRQRLIDGHLTWNQTKHDCGKKDQDNFRMFYDGDTPNRFQTEDDENGPDGVEVVDFGSLRNVAGCEGGVACATVFRSPTSQDIPETDIRLNNRVAFWPKTGRIRASGCVPKPSNQSSCLDAWATTAHEVGHSLGFDEIPQ